MSKRRSSDMGMNIGIVRSDVGIEQVCVEIHGTAVASLCMSARVARIYADAMREAADLLEERSGTAGRQP